jgi:multimeric flavodoxin WrbA
MTGIGKVLGISGSPRRDGNTELLLKEFSRGARASGHETELIILNKFNIAMYILRFLPGKWSVYNR